MPGDVQQGPEEVRGQDRGGRDEVRLGARTDAMCGTEVFLGQTRMSTPPMKDKRHRADRSVCPTFSTALLVLLAMAAPGVRAANGAVDFNCEVRPILAGACFKCHGP